MVRLFVGVTDKSWFDTLGASAPNDEINFWQPSGTTQFRALKPGELFLFKLHAPNNFIVGGGIFGPVYDAVDDDIGAHNAIDQAPRLMVQFPIFGNSDTRQFLRNISAGGEFFKLGAGTLDFRHHALCRLVAVAASDEAIEILDVAFRFLGEKNTIWHQGCCPPDICGCARRIPQRDAVCPPRPAGW